MKTTAWAAIVVVMFASAIVGWRGFARSRDTRPLLDELATKQRRLDAELALARTRIVKANGALEKLRTAPPAAAATPQKSATVAKLPEPALPEVLEAHPELRSLFRREYRLRLRDDYHSFYRDARLTGEQIEKFEELMLAAEEEKMDLEATLRAQRSGNAIGAELRQQLDAKLRAAQIELLGEDGYAQLLESKQPEVRYLSNIENQLALTALTLTQNQREQLLHVLRTKTRADAMGKRTIDWPEVWPVAETILSPAQFATFKAESAWTQFQYRVREFGIREVATRTK